MRVDKKDRETDEGHENDWEKKGVDFQSEVVIRMSTLPSRLMTIHFPMLWMSIMVIAWNELNMLEFVMQFMPIRFFIFFFYLLF